VQYGSHETTDQSNVLPPPEDGRSTFISSKLHGVTSQKSGMLIFIAVRFLNLTKKSKNAQDRQTAVGYKRGLLSLKVTSLLCASSGLLSD
jgi:hypothetical protein